jgi:protein-L-isoaspartate(D-aspartate) O-methyltransferase
LAYLALRRLDNGEPARWELGAVGHGPAGPDLAGRICQQTRVWDQDRTVQPLIIAHPSGTPDTPSLRTRAIHKPHSVIEVVF